MGKVNPRQQTHTNDPITPQAQHKLIVKKNHFSLNAQLELNIFNQAINTSRSLSNYIFATKNPFKSFAAYMPKVSNSDACQ